MCRHQCIVHAVVTACCVVMYGNSYGAPAPFLGPIVEVTEEIGGFVNTFAEHGHSMHDGRIVWRDDVSDLYLYSGTRPPTKFGEGGQPAVFGDTIARSLNGVTLYSITTAEETPVATMGVFDRAVTHGGRVAWTGFGGPEGQGVFLHDGDTVRKIADSSLNHDGVALDGMRLVWIGPGDGFQIYDLASGQITSRSGPGQRPAISGNHLVFEGFFSNPGIYFHNLDADPADPVRIATVGHGPSIQGDHIVFSDGAGEIQLYTISTGEAVPLGLTGFDPILSGNYLSWGDGVDLFITTIPEPAALGPLSLVAVVLCRRR